MIIGEMSLCILPCNMELFPLRQMSGSLTGLCISVMKHKHWLRIVLSMVFISNLLSISWQIKIRRPRSLNKLHYLLRIPDCPRRLTLRGVFDRDGSQSLYLFVDVKTDGLTTCRTWCRPCSLSGKKDGWLEWMGQVSSRDLSPLSGQAIPSCNSLLIWR